MPRADGFRNRAPAASRAGTLLTVTEPPDLEARVAALEGRVEELSGRVRRSEQDAAAARVLAGGADRDVGEMRGEIRDFKQAATASFNAMRADLNDLRTETHNGFTELRIEMNGRFAAVDRGFAEMRARFDATAAGLEQIAALIARREEDGG